MTINSNLYPLKFKPILKSIIWGGSDISKFKNIEPIQEGIGESWEISGVPGDISIIENGALAGISLKTILSEKREKLVGSEVYHKFGNKISSPN